MLRWLSRTFSALLVVIGLIWLLQGLDLLGGSFMTGDPVWAVAGLISIVVGVPLLYLSLRTAG